MQNSTIISTVISTVEYCLTSELLTAMPSIATKCIWLPSIYSARAEGEPCG
jgi:hypothetical protein